MVVVGGITSAHVVSTSRAPVPRVAVGHTLLEAQITTIIIIGMVTLVAVFIEIIMSGSIGSEGNVQVNDKNNGNSSFAHVAVSAFAVVDTLVNVTVSQCMKFIH